MKIRQHIFARCGFTLVEIMAALVILAVAVLGASGYRYYAALDARKAAMQAGASRVATLLCESWRGVEGDESYDPAHNFGPYIEIEGDKDSKEAPPDGFTLLGRYVVLVDQTSYHAVLSWNDIRPGLRALNVTVAWAQPRQGAGAAGTDKALKLTTYTSY